jgi:UDP-N-acetylglucosamine:LPS N-acetylglucosamine transferase
MHLSSTHGDASPEVDVLLVCSAGGHLLQLYLLHEAWAGRSHAWVTHGRDDARSLLAGSTVFYAYEPTTRNLANLARNLILAWRVLRLTRPRVILTTGAAVSVPFAWMGRLTGRRVVYIESLTRTERPSLSCRLVRPVANRRYVQWPELARAVPGARFVGNVFGSL